MLSLSLFFLLTFVSLIDKSDTPYSKKFLITGINEQYAGNDELQNEFKKVTKEIMNLWDSIALVNETIVIDTLGQHDPQTNRYVAHFTVTQVYDEIIKKEQGFKNGFEMMFAKVPEYRPKQAEHPPAAGRPS